MIKRIERYFESVVLQIKVKAPVMTRISIPENPVMM